MKLCTECYYVGREKTKHKGSFIGEAMLWFFTLCFGVAGFLAPFLWLLAVVLFIVALVYSIQRLSGSKVCPKCEHSSMIPVDSDRAKKLVTENKIELPEPPTGLIRYLDADGSFREIGLFRLILIGFLLLVVITIIVQKS